MVIRGKVDNQTLLNIYDTCNRIFDKSDCFYTEQELEEKKQEKGNIFIGKENNNGKQFGNL